MNHSEALELITEYLLTRSVNENLLQEAERHVANCRQCIAELDATIPVFTGKASQLKEKASKFLTCDECSELLPEYAEPENAEAKEKYPVLAIHLQSCAKCRDVYEQLVDLIQKEKEGIFGPDPSHVRFDEIANIQVPGKKGVSTTRQILDIVLKISKEAIDVVRSTGDILRPTPEVVLRGKKVEVPEKESIRVRRDFTETGYSVEMNIIQEPGQQTFTVTFSVMELETEEFSEGFTIQLEGKSKSSEKKTDHKGIVEFYSLAVGNYQFTVRNIQGEEVGQVRLNLDR